MATSLPVSTMLIHMSKWEYTITPLMLHQEGPILNNWGEDGWELVTVISPGEGKLPMAYFKRPKN